MCVDSIAVSPEATNTLPRDADGPKSSRPVETPARERLIASAAALFAEKSFGGVSVREICKHAGTSINMIHHYFGNKEGLLDAIIEQYDSRVFVVPLRLLEAPAESAADFAARIELLFETTLEAHIEQRAVMMVAIREQADLAALLTYQEKIVAFLEQGKEKGFVRPDVDTAMVTGAMLDRSLNQVAFSPWVKRTQGVDIMSDADYRRRWCKSNVDLFLHGLMA